MWEASQAENSRLKMEMNSLRLELESTKHQLENAFQVRRGILIRATNTLYSNLQVSNIMSSVLQATNNSVSDTEKEEKQAMEKKLEEMEEKIKVTILLTSTMFRFLKS